MPKLPGALRFARMAGSSVAAPGAAAWVTDFLNAAYYARESDEREVRDLRLAHGIITTFWNRESGRLGFIDLFALHRTFWRLRRERGGKLDHDSLLAGGTRLLGGWFPEAWLDDERRGYGIAFESVEERRAFVPETRQASAALKGLTPPVESSADQQWSTNDPVSLPNPDGALELLMDPRRWPDMGSANGRFTPVRSGPLKGQTFEIEVVAKPAPRSPIFTRGYVTCTTAIARNGEAGNDAELDEAIADLEQRYAAGAGPDAGPLLDAGAEAIALVIMTTHEGHFLGSALSQLLVWRDNKGSWIRDVGAWDPLAPHLAAAYAASGKKAQHEFWGPEPPEKSMLAQLALVTGQAENAFSRS